MSRTSNAKEASIVALFKSANSYRPKTSDDDFDEPDVKVCGGFGPSSVAQKYPSNDL